MVAAQIIACGANEAENAAPQVPAEETSNAQGPDPASTATAAPAPFDASAPHGGLLPEQIRKVVMRHTGELRTCYEAESSSQPGLRGIVIVAWRIDPQGFVHESRVVRSTLPPAASGVAECVAQHIGALQFESSDSPTDIAQYPFKLGMYEGDAGTH